MHVGQRFIHLPDHAVGLADGAVNIIEGGGQLAVVDLHIEIVVEGGHVALGISGQIVVEIVHDPAERAVDHRLEKARRVLPQGVLQLVQTRGVQHGADRAPHGVGNAVQRTVQLIDGVIEKIQRLDARQLQGDVLVKVEIHLPR